MNTILREIVIPINALVDKSISPGNKLLLWTIAYLTDEKGEWMVDAILLKDMLGIEPNNLAHKLCDIEKAGYIKKTVKYETKTARYTVVSLTNKFMKLVKWNNGSELKNLNHSKELVEQNPLYNNGDGSELRKLNHSDDIERVEGETIYRIDERGNPIIPTEQENGEIEKDIQEKNTIDTIDNSKLISEKINKNLGDYNLHKKVHKKEVVKGKLFNTIYSDKKDINPSRKDIVAKMFTYADMEFSKINLAEPVVKMFKSFLSQMLTCRRVTGEQVKALVAQVIKFKQTLGYYDEEIIECLQDSLLRNWMYIKPIDNLNEYRMKKTAMKDLQEGEEYNNNNGSTAGRKVTF